MKSKSLIGRRARLKTQTIFGRKPGLLTIVKVSPEDDPLCWCVEIDTGRSIHCLRSELSVMRHGKIAAGSVDTARHQTVFEKRVRA
jgi:hypothetical protein